MEFLSPQDFFERIPELGKINLELCVTCKGTQLKCGMKSCPILKAFEIKPKATERIETISFGKTIHGPSPQVFVGSGNYPSVFAGPTSLLFPDQLDPRKVADPKQWINLSLDEIIEMRYSTAQNLKQVKQIQNLSEPHVSAMQEVALASNVVEIEGELERTIKTTATFDPITQPFGPRTEIRKFAVTTNPKIPKKVDMVLNDDLPATIQLHELHQAGFDVYYLQNVFSTGLFGTKNRQKIVPTRWSITAIDDSLGRAKIRKLKDMPSVNEILVFQGGILGNYFTIALFPGSWKFENFEVWAANSIYTLGTKGFLSVDSEGFDVQTQYKGRSKYASQAGGYYAARLAVLEYLMKNNRQATVLSIREITPEYTIPAGVWVVREAARSAMKNPPLKFQSKDELKDWLEINIQRPLIDITQKSKILGQQSLLEFL